MVFGIMVLMGARPIAYSESCIATGAKGAWARLAEIIMSQQTKNSFMLSEEFKFLYFLRHEMACKSSEGFAAMSKL